MVCDWSTTISKRAHTAIAFHVLRGKYPYYGHIAHCSTETLGRDVSYNNSIGPSIGSDAQRQKLPICEFESNESHCKMMHLWYNPVRATL